MEKLHFNKKLYSKTALLKAAYNFTDTAYIHLDLDDDYYYVTIQPKTAGVSVSKEDFKNEMLTQSVRHEVYLETKNIRTLLLARAMATSMVGDIEEEVPCAHEEYDEDAILKDWFDTND